MKHSLRTRLGLVVVAAIVGASGLAALAGASGVAPLVAVPVAVALGLLITQLLATGLLAPVRDMTMATRSMAAGNYDARLSVAGVTREDEIGELARSFTAMAASLETVDRQRRDLVANVSHELRTPVAALRAVLENLTDGVVEPDARRLGTALAQADRLASLVDDLLDLGRLDAGLVPLDSAPLDVAVLIERVLVEARVASGRDVAFDSSAPDGLTITGDAARLHQALANLIDNAVRHAPDGSRVEVTAQPALPACAAAAATGVVIDVRDHGPGIEPSRREQVFDRFETSAASGGGTGLGLAIARWVAVLHGGSLEALSPTEGRGALLRLSLPAEPPLLLAIDPSIHEEAPMSSATAPPTDTDVASVGSRNTSTPRGWWPEPRPEGRPALLAAALLVGTFAAVTTYHLAQTTLAQTLLLWGMIAVAAWPARRRLDRVDAATVALSVLLAAVPVLRDADWIASLCVIAAGGLLTATVVGARTLAGIFASGILVPLAGLRGLPWLGRTVESTMGRTSLAAARTIVVSVLLVLVVGGLLASGDAVFAGMVDAVLPSFDLGETVPRTLLALIVAGITLAGAYAALNPPRLDHVDRAVAPRPRWEWLAPIALIDLVLTVFLVGQAAALFGGEAFVARTTGLTYAEYARTGFGQMVAVTLVVLALVSWAARRASADDRPVARGALGLLVVLTLLVVASALSRMATYEDAFGLTRLRLLVFVFEGWLGLMLVAVLAAGVVWRGRWLARIALLSGAVALLGLALTNPDARIAERNLDVAGGVDRSYLLSLSTDAYGALPPQLRYTCVEAGPYAGDLDLSDSWLGWNLGRARAEAICAE